MKKALCVIGIVFVIFLIVMVYSCCAVSSITSRKEEEEFGYEFWKEISESEEENL